MGRSRAFLRILAVICFFAHGLHAEGPVESLADQALAAAPCSRGLCIHIGCGSEANPQLTAELARRGKMLVHGLAIDDASAGRAINAIENAGVAGQASVERITVAPLPYAPNISNLAIIENWNLVAKAGLTRDEVMRVLAPGGALCMLENGKWTTTVKPRPADMDDWQHPGHDSGLTRVSNDKTFSFPIGLRWTDGLPNNLRAFTDCGGWVVSKGILFTISTAEFENLGRRQEDGYELWLVARDAFNGLPLWKISLHMRDKGESINAANVPTLAADDASVYTVRDRNRVIRVDARTGEVLWEGQAKHPIYRLMLSEGVVVTGSWATRNNVWYYYFPDPDTGITEAFDAASGKPLWQLAVTPEQLAGSDGVVHIQAAATRPAVLGVDLHKGRELWRTEQTEGEKPKVTIVSAGPNYVVVTHSMTEKQRYSRVLEATTGREIASGKEKKQQEGWAPRVNGLLWFLGRKLDPANWSDQGPVGMWIGGHGCTPQGIVWPYLLDGRGGTHVDLAKRIARQPSGIIYYGARAACLEGMVIANGMLYTAQNGCKCMPPHLYGFLCLAPCGAEPSAEDFSSPRAAEKGPAYGMQLAADVPDNEGTSWPMLRADAARSASSKCKLPAKLKELWSVRITPQTRPVLADAWDSQLASPVSSPVVGGGTVFVSARDEGQVVALDPASGKRLWTVTLPSRLDGPPTIYRGLCILGCHDGLAYALRAADGAIVWRVQLAPISRRIVDHGRVESLWPAPASVLASDGVVYATAGRTSESDGGLAVAAMDAAGGKMLWSRQIAPGALRLNDILSIKGERLAWRYMLLDKSTGKTIAPASMPTLRDTAGGGGILDGAIVDGTYTMAQNRRGGKIFEFAGQRHDMLAWTDRIAASPRAILSPAGQSIAPVPLPRGRAMAIALAGNVAVYAFRDSEYASPEAKGSLKLISLEDGRLLQDLALEAPPAYDGVAIAGGKVYLSLQNGTTMCLGGE